MAGVAVRGLLDKLGRLDKHHHAHRIHGLETEIDLLKRDLSDLKVFLQMVEESRDRKENVIQFVERRIARLEIRIAKFVYEFEDKIDVYLRKTNNFFRRILIGRDLRSCRERNMAQLRKAIEEYRSTFRDSSLTNLSVEESRATSVNLTLATSFPPIGIDNVVGRDNEEKTIISYLTEPSQELSVICIQGVGGLGKTTLARKIYENSRIASEFPVRIWIYDSNNYSIGDVLRNILRVFTSQDVHSLSDEELTETVVTCLEKKRFLLVLDDIMDEIKWDALLKILPKSNNKGKVLITTRRSSVGDAANYNMMLRELNADESWELLQLKGFGNLEIRPKDFEAMWRDIADRCSGLPLYITLVGGMSWGPLMKSSIEDLFKELPTAYEISSLDYFYRNLSDELRQCFLYVWVFPANYEISAWTLTHLWIAEGLVQPMEGRSLEEEATRTLDYLIRMNFVTVDKINPVGKVKTCRVHEQIYELCRHYTLFDGWGRHLCVHSEVEISILTKVQIRRTWVRSLLCFNESSTGMDPSFLDAFEFLRVLESKSIKFHTLPQQITKLFNLRYVTLSIDDLNTLPESLSKLWNLETLVIVTKSRVITMKANIWRLIFLRHLKTNAAIVLSSNKQGQTAEDLQTLTRLSPESCTGDVYERAHNLKTLGIRGDLHILFRKEFLQKFDHLEKLKLIHDSFPDISSENPLLNLPHINCFPPNLKWLTLSNTYLLWDLDMPMLADIETLEVLKLKDDAFTGVIWTDGEGYCFPSLKFLLIDNVDLVLWKASTDVLPKLSCLVVKNCQNLREVPMAIAENLEKLEIEHLGKSAVESVKRIAELRQGDNSFKLYVGPGCYY